MTGLAFGEIVSGLKPLKEFRTFQPVWRNSYYEGQLEDRVWQPVGIGRARGSKRAGRRFAQAVIKAAETLERTTRAKRRSNTPGVRNGVLGDIGIGVLKALYDIVDYATGRLEPAIATIAERTGYSYSAVHRALCRLRQHGFLHWIRRSRQTENKGEAGPQVEQIPNAYALTVPEQFKELLRRLLDDAPVPADEAWRRQQLKRDFSDQLRSLATATEFARDFVHSAKFGETLSAIAAALDLSSNKERESSRKRETGGSF